MSSATLRDEYAPTRSTRLTATPAVDTSGRDCSAERALRSGPPGLRRDPLGAIPALGATSSRRAPSFLESGGLKPRHHLPHGLLRLAQHTHALRFNTKEPLRAPAALGRGIAFEGGNVAF